ncbi:MAG: ribosome silencing factor [Desulfocurvibacter africanus]
MQKVKELHRTISTTDKVKTVATWLRDKKAIDIIALDVRGISPITESLVVVTASSVRHAQGLANHILDKVSEEKLEYLGMEGSQQGSWILIDLNDVLVHIFQTDNRQFYNIEGLWSEGTPIELPFHADD